MWSSGHTQATLRHDDVISKCCCGQILTTRSGPTRQQPQLLNDLDIQIYTCIDRLVQCKLPALTGLGKAPGAAVFLLLA